MPMPMVELAHRLNKPEYWFQPRQLVRKLLFELGRYSEQSTTRVGLPWGAEISVNPHESIGKSLLTYGVYELAVSEILWRLTERGERCLDVGANIGYMTSLLSVASGGAGQVISFEPHPRMFAHLAANSEAWRNLTPELNYAAISLRPYALGAAAGELDLAEPERFNENEGGATLRAAQPAAADGLIRHRVQVRCLDQAVDAVTSYGVMKVDVEGAEEGVVLGAQQLLGEHRIRDIVFEDFQPFPSPTIMLLKDAGYQIYRLAKSLRGPMLWDPAAPTAMDRSLPWEPVNYLATIDAQRALARLQPRGWRCLSNHH